MQKRRSLSRILFFVLSGFYLAWMIKPTIDWPNRDSFLVEIINRTAQDVVSIELDFGYADGQTQQRLLRLPTEQTRFVFLNHQPGAGFNVRVVYADGLEQEFCANRGDEARRQQLVLQR